MPPGGKLISQPPGVDLLPRGGQNGVKNVMLTYGPGCRCAYHEEETAFLFEGSTG